MPARKHLTAARVNSLSVGREASALQAEANIVTDADFQNREDAAKTHPPLGYPLRKKRATIGAPPHKNSLSWVLQIQVRS
jgi:hypothetical protein